MIKLAEPDITDFEIQAVTDVLRSGRLSMGPKLEAFEQAVAERAGRKYGIGVNSGTSALDVAVKAYNIGPGDEVVTTPFTFVATTNVILANGATPVFVGIDESYNMVPEEVEAAITPKTRAIMAVSVFGNMQHFERRTER
jgi:perosamine synthetase